MADASRLLSSTPDVLRVWLGGLPEGWEHATEGGETWSPFDVVGHLIHGETTDWMTRIKMILEDGESRPFPSFDRLGHRSASAGRSLPELLQEFARLRSENLRKLERLQLSEADWDRRGLHPELGPVTLRQLLATWVAHDMDHLMQIARVLGRQYADEVGPWRKYLRVISGEQG